MEKFLRAYLDRSLLPNRVQHLVVSDSKHLYFRKSDEVVAYQKKELDPRTCGNRCMLTRLIAIDEDTGVFYGELSPRDEPIDLVGFLARTWSAKPHHPMRGFPEILVVPSVVLNNEGLRDQISCAIHISGAQLEKAAGGFGPATVAAREYERQLMYAGAAVGKLNLVSTSLASQEISLLGCSNSYAVFGKAWEKVSGMSDDAKARFDELYEPHGAWRLDEFAHIDGRAPGQ